ncbi:iron-sulfur cluster assembly scaffold protein [bacterium]|nr:iron-sulfur cluster assembly scaffold protein [bacterium]
MYSEQFMYHFQSPRYVGVMPDATAEVEVCYEENGCMDWIRLYLKLDDGLIRDARFNVRGCSGVVAACSAMCTLVVGRRVEVASKLDPMTIAIELGGVPPNKEHSLRLARKALLTALNGGGPKWRVPPPKGKGPSPDAPFASGA